LGGITICCSCGGGGGPATVAVITVSTTPGIIVHLEFSSCQWRRFILVRTPPSPVPGEGSRTILDHNRILASFVSVISTKTTSGGTPSPSGIVLVDLLLAPLPSGAIVFPAVAVAVGALHLTPPTTRIGHLPRALFVAIVIGVPRQ